MKNTTTTAIRYSTLLVTLILAALVSVVLFLFSALMVQAATYAYVGSDNEVKTVTANDPMTAIATAPGIHAHSGVYLMNEASDYGMVGDTVKTQ